MRYQATSLFLFAEFSLLHFLENAYLSKTTLTEVATGLLGNAGVSPACTMILLVLNYTPIPLLASLAEGLFGLYE